MKKLLLTLWNVPDKRFYNSTVAIDYDAHGYDKVEAIYRALSTQDSKLPVAGYAAATLEGRRTISMNRVDAIKDQYVITNVHELN
jgi:hypothetical protein